MFVKYNNELHYVTKTVDFLSKTVEEKVVKKRKNNKTSSSSSLTEKRKLYILFNINNPNGEFAIISEECTEVKLPLENNTYFDFCTIVEREFCKRYNFDWESSVDYNDYFWRVSYKSDKTGSCNTYDIYSIDKIMEDGFLCTLYSSNEIRHFKFKNLYNDRFSDGIINKHFDSY